MYLLNQKLSLLKLLIRPSVFGEYEAGGNPAEIECGRRNKRSRVPRVETQLRSCEPKSSVMF